MNQKQNIMKAKEKRCNSENESASQIGMDKKSKMELMLKVSRCEYGLKNKEKNLFGKIVSKGFEKWNDNDIEFLTLLVDLYHFTPTSIWGTSIYSFEQGCQIRKEEELKKIKAYERLQEEPYVSWMKNLRNYKLTN